jgi:hypothetical protein
MAAYGHKARDAVLAVSATCFPLAAALKLTAYARQQRRVAVEFELLHDAARASLRFF